MKRYLILFLALVLILGCMAGCRRKDNTVSTDPDGMIGNSEQSTQNTRPSTTESTTEATTRNTETTDRTEASEPMDQTTESSAPDSENTESSGEDTVGRARRTRPLFQ